METMSAMAGLFLFGSRVIAYTHCPYKWFHRVSGQHRNNRQGWFHHRRISQRKEYKKMKIKRQIKLSSEPLSFYRLFRNFLECRRVFFFRAPPASTRSPKRLTPCSAITGGTFTFRFRVVFLECFILFKSRIFLRIVLKGHEHSCVDGQQENQVLYLL